MKKTWKQTIIIVIIMMMTLFISIGYAQYECVQGNCINGTGKLAVKKSKAFLEGKFINGVHVEGKVVFPNGDIFEGIFKDHKLKEGIKKFKNGKVLEGKFIENVLVDGIFREPDGATRRIKLKPLGAGSIEMFKHK